jgi:putative heme-binding domain-containing protein
MGNIHGSAINVDRIQRKGSTYAATPEPDLLQAHDAWFMPVAQKVGPDGALWILDWYDRYHCYQDARRDPEGIDRGLGRLYRIAPPSTPRYAGDINKLSDQELLHLLADENVWKRRQARQKLIERGTQSRELEAVALDRQQSAKARLEALWTRAGQLSIPGSLLSELRDDADPVLRAWSVRLAGDFDPTVGMAVGIIGRALNEADPRVTLETVIAAGKRFPSQEAASRIMESASRHPEDTHLQQIAWKNLNAHLPASTGTLAQIFESHSGRIVTLPDGTLVRRRDLSIFFSPENLAKSEFLARLISRLFTLPDSEETHVTSIMKSLLASTSPQVFRLALRGLFDASREKGTSAALAKRIAQSAVALPHLHADDEVARLGLQLLTGAADARSAVLSHLQEGHLLDDERLSLLEALCLADETPTQEIVALLPLLVNQLKEGSLPELWRILARRDGDEIGHALLKTVSTLAPQSRPQVVDVLISRPKWADLLLTAVEQNAFDKGEVGIQHIRSLAASRQSALRDRAAKIWGQVRPHDAAERTAVVQRMRAHLNEGKSNPYAGKAVFERVCAQCHKLRGQGHDLGPELTRNGTDSLDNLLTSIFDPNLLIGDDYEAKLIITVDGRSLQGLVVESTDERIVLKVPGGQLVNILRAEIDELTDSKQSLMPEGLEQQLSPKDLRDLIAYIRQSSTTK